tara:strand:+ start:67526 stop:67960 length:435 start_codon:yes stop_codon:yes gene_type:complete
MPTPVEILLVEDNPADANLFLRKMKQAKVPYIMHVVQTGHEALDFVQRKGAYADSPALNLILLDLNLPGIDGREVLKTLKSDPELRTIPVIVFTSSEAEDDITQSYELSANAYVRKPLDLAGYQTIVDAIDGFWLGVVRFKGRV